MKPNIYAKLSIKWGDQVTEESCMFYNDIDSKMSDLKVACKYLASSNDEEVIGYSIYKLEHARVFVEIEEMATGAFPFYTWEVGIIGDILVRDYPAPYKEYRQVRKTWFSNNCTTWEDAMKNASEEVKVLSQYLDSKKEFCLRA